MAVVAPRSCAGDPAIERVLGAAAFVADTLVVPARRSFVDPNRRAQLSFCSALVGWTATATSYLGMPENLTRSKEPWDWHLASAVPSRFLVRTGDGAGDVAVTAPFRTSTYRCSDSLVEGQTSDDGDIAWHGAKPVVLLQLDSRVELATPRGDGLWEWGTIATRPYPSAPSGLALSLQRFIRERSVFCQPVGQRLVFR